MPSPVPWPLWLREVFLPATRAPRRSRALLLVTQRSTEEITPRAALWPEAAGLLSTMITKCLSVLLGFAIKHP